MKNRIAIIDDEVRLGQILQMLLTRQGYEVEVWADPQQFLKDLPGLTVDLVLTDLKMPQISGIDVLKAVKEKSTATPVILMTAHSTVATAVEAMKLEAYDYIEKPFDNDLCIRLVEKALDYSQISREVHYLRQEVRAKYSLDNFVVASSEMKQVVELCQKAARSKATVLVHGASGTGKELIARSIHFHSHRVGKPFIAVNCKAFAAAVLESELFGHEKGAYTGAVKTRSGTFELAHGGTVFLDEIGEIDLDFQGKLLRVLQEKEVQRVGGDRPIPVDVRIVCATNRDLKQEVKEGRFREDLYFRLAVIPVSIPALRDRPDDIVPLAQHFMSKFAEEMGIAVPIMTKELPQDLRRYPWPGNVRELENSIERALVLASDSEICWDDLMIDDPQRDQTHLSLAKFVDEATRTFIAKVLEESQWKKSEAAHRLGIERTTLYRMMKKYQISTP